MNNNEPAVEGFLQSTTSARTASRLLPWIGLALAIATFILDLMFVQATTLVTGYLLAVLATHGEHRSRATFGMAVLASLMTVVAMASTERSAVSVSPIILNGAITLAGIWVTAIAVRAYSQVNERAEEAETLAHLREHWLVQTLASIGDGVIATDANGRIEFMNAVAEDLTGWSSKEAVGKPSEAVFEIIEENSGERADNPVERALGKERTAFFEQHTVLRARDGRMWPIDDSASPIRDHAGNITGVVMVFREIADRRKGEQQMELRLREAGHRIANVFASVRAMLTICQRAAQTPADLVNCVDQRLGSLVRSSDRLMRATNGGTWSTDIIMDELTPYLDKGADRLRLSGENFQLRPDVAVAFGMIVHELAHNASKYGSLSTNVGRVELNLHKVGERQISMTWKETGGPPVTKPERTGLGTHLVNGLLRTQFSGKWTTEYLPEGLVCRLNLTLPNGEMKPPQV